jgi:hypothetical protein
MKFARHPELAALAPTFTAALPGPETAVFWPLSALRAHTEAPYKTDLLRETLRPLKNRIRRVSLKKKMDARARAAWASCGFESRESNAKFILNI